MSTQTKSPRPQAGSGTALDLPSGEALLRQRLLEVLLTAAHPPKMTYDEFLAWADEDARVEWAKGEVIVTSPASKLHQSIADFLLKVMGTYVETRQLGTVISAPFQMKLETSGREPDLLFVTNEHANRFRESYLDGPADLIVEIVSPDSIGRDRGEKFAEYEAGGVPEYWLIDPQRRWTEVYQLQDGRYRLVFSGMTGAHRSQALAGFSLRVEWLWQEPLPQLLDVLRELQII